MLDRYDINNSIADLIWTPRSYIKVGFHFRVKWNRCWQPCMACTTEQKVPNSPILTIGFLVNSGLQRKMSDTELVRQKESHYLYGLSAKKQEIFILCERERLKSQSQNIHVIKILVLKLWTLSSQSVFKKGHAQGIKTNSGEKAFTNIGTHF